GSRGVSYSGWTREGSLVGARFGNEVRDGATTGRRRLSGKAGASRSQFFFSGVNPFTALTHNVGDSQICSS
ncbi:L-arabinose isomerase, partial [Sesbania bispinosa]